MKYKTTILFILSLTITTTFITSSLIAQGYSDPQTDNELSTNLLGFGDYAPDWSLKEVTSDITRSMSYYRGKVVILEFFATWCNPCTNEFLPELKKIRARYSTSELAIVSINTDPDNENETLVEHYADLFNINWHVFRDTATVSDDYDVRTIPTFYIIDEKQFIHYSHTGVVDENFLIGKLSDLITPQRTPNEWWVKNWWWFAGGIIVVGILSVAVIQRRRVILHNRKVDEQTLETRRRKRRAKER
ncbi:MAG: TlpA family protein disulfide reductase [Candidatus Heimdallarchaeota archaeon]